VLENAIRLFASKEAKTYRVKDGAKSLELFLEVVFLALELGDGQVPRSTVGDGCCGWPRRDSGRVEVAHICLHTRLGMALAANVIVFATPSPVAKGACEFFDVANDDAKQLPSGAPPPPGKLGAPKDPINQMMANQMLQGLVACRLLAALAVFSPGVLDLSTTTSRARTCIIANQVEPQTQP
jgi:hypothetical protein